MLSSEQPYFALARRYGNIYVPGWTQHIAAHSADLDLNPPESYLFIQDLLIFLCATSWTWWYAEAIHATIKDRRSPVPLSV